MFSLDIFKTKKMFHTSVTITDGTSISPKDEEGVQIGTWIHRDRLVSKVCIAYKKKDIKFLFYKKKNI